jgi:hypothetical protein
VEKNKDSDCIVQENVLLSAQVLGVFFKQVTRHIQQPMSAEHVKEVIDMLSILSVKEIDLAIIKRSVETTKIY